MTSPRPWQLRARRYLLVTRGGEDGRIAARWLRGADPAAAVTVLCLLRPPVVAWWSEDALDFGLAERLHAQRAEQTLDEVFAALDLPERRIRTRVRSGDLTREIRAELRQDAYAAVVVGLAPGRVGRLDVPLILVPAAPAGRLVSLRS